MKQRLALQLVTIVAATLLFSSSVAQGYTYSKLVVSVSESKDPISRGSIQTVTVTVTSGGQKIKDASVSAKVIYASGFTKSFSGKTDKNGMWKFSWKIGGNSAPGTFTVQVTASKYYYQSGSGSTTFTVTKAK